MKPYITLKEAAAIAGVDRQTIINWAKKRYFKYKIVTRNVYSIDYKSFIDCLSPVEEIINLEQLISDKKNELETVKRIDDIRKSLKISDNEYRVIYAILNNIDYSRFLTEREIQIKDMVLNGYIYEDIADHFGLTKERINQIFKKLLRRIEVYSRKLEYDRIQSIYKENMRLKNIISVYESKAKIEEDELDLLSREHELDNNHKMIKIEDMILSKRALNCLKSAEITTLYDLLQFSRIDLLRYRNFGRKTMTEIEELLQEMDLSLKINSHAKTN